MPGYGMPNQSPAHQPQDQRSVVHQLPRRHRAGHGVHQRRDRRMDRRRQGPPHPLPPARAAQPGRRGKKNACSLKAELDALFGVTARATASAAAAQRLREHMLAALLCPEEGTVTNLLCTAGRQQEDWSAAYRLYERDRVDESALFAEVLDQVMGRLAPAEPLVVAMDDTLLRKRGPHIHGVAW